MAERLTGSKCEELGSVGIGSEEDVPHGLGTHSGREDGLSIVQEGKIRRAVPVGEVLLDFRDVIGEGRDEIADIGRISLPCDRAASRNGSKSSCYSKR